MTFDQAIVSCFKKYAVFKGRAPRSEYWWFALFIFVTEVAAMIVGSSIHMGFLVNIVQLAVLLPQISVGVRRLHDINRSGWWIGGLYIALALAVVMAIALIHTQPVGSQMSPVTGIVLVIFGLIAFVYGVTLFIFTLIRGTNGPNDYGPDPLASSSEQTPTQSFR